MATACAEERIVDRPVALQLPDATSCRPIAPLASLRLRALGDGPASEVSLIDTERGDPAIVLPELAFPILAVQAFAEAPGWSGSGWRPLDASGSELPLLPLRRSCPLADPDARAPIGAATTLLPDGTLVVAGGLGDDGFAMARVALLAPGAQLAELAGRGLALPSAHASVTALDDGRLLIAGGVLAESAPSSDRFEIFDPHLADAAQIIEPLQARRRDHSAIRLRDGRVLLVGGRSAGAGTELATLELVDPRARQSTIVPTSLGVPRSRPLLALAEDGAVWIAGGEDAGVPRAIERFDPATGALETFAGASALPDPIALAWLPGNRLAWIAQSAIAIVLLREDRPIVVAPAADALATTLDEARAAATSGGRVLVVGHDDGVRAAYSLDPGHGRIEPRDASRVASELVTMIDGIVVELSAAGASVRREPEPTPHDDPPVTLLFGTDDEWWVRDPTGHERWAAPRWDVRGTELIALEAGARVDLRAIRGSRFSLELRASGAVEVLVLGDAAVQERVSIDDAAAALGACAVPRAPGSPVTLDVDPGRIRLSAGLGARDCESRVAGRVGLAFVARDAGAALSRVDVARR